MGFPKRGQICYVSLDPIMGSEIGKTRPSIIISNDRNNEFSDTITVLPITSQTKEVYPFEVLLLKKDSSLPYDSKIKCNQIRTIDKARVVKLLGVVSDKKIAEIERALLIHLGIRDTLS
jgi:mRNA interferase MazF